MASHLINVYEEKPSTYRNFLLHSHEIEQEVDTIIKGIPQQLGDSINQNPEGLDVLDLGAGEGSKSIPIVVYMQQHGTVRYTALDPSIEQLKKLRQKAHSARIKHIRFVNETWENYEPNAKYNFILCLHTFYHLKDWKLGLKKIMNALKPQGMALFTLMTSNHISYRLNHELSQLLYENQRWDLHHAEEFTHLLQQEGISFATHTSIETFDLKPLKEQTSEGLETLEFIISRPLESLPSQIRKRLFHTLNEFPDYANNEVKYFWVKQ